MSAFGASNSAQRPEHQLAPNEKALSVAEVYFLLQAKRMQMTDSDQQPSEMMEKTIKYAEQFAGNNGVSVRSATAKPVAQNLRRLLETMQFGHTEVRALDSLQIASLLNFFPENGEEARLLIPSLATGFTENELDEVVAQMHQVVEGKSFVAT
jgi:DNA-directed RNA polymerase subunit F